MHDILLASSNNTLASIPLVILYFIYIIIFILCIICILSTSCMFVCMHEIENDCILSIVLPSYMLEYAYYSTSSVRQTIETSQAVAQNFVYIECIVQTIIIINVTS